MNRRDALKSLGMAAIIPTLAQLTSSAQAVAGELPNGTPGDMEAKGIAFLISKQEADGGWLSQKIGPAVTALVAKALIQSGRGVDDPAVKKALANIDSFRKKDGGYYKEGQPNYNTAITLSLLSMLPAKQYKEQIKGAQDFLRATQQTEGKKDAAGKVITKDNPWYGGSGYGEDRPDMSNTSFFIEAMHDSGVSPTDPALQKALVFVSRSQNNEGTNDQAFAKGATDGGFIYTPEGQSKFGDIDSVEGDSKLRSYGSMTYAGIKSMIYCGLGKDDPRVKAALIWIKGNWSLDENPGTGGSSDGLFYYFNTFAKAMAAYGEASITDVKGTAHDWRKELTATLGKRQNADGSWVNAKSPRWLEFIPTLATVYAVLALQEARR